MTTKNLKGCDDDDDDDDADDDFDYDGDDSLDEKKYSPSI